MKTRILCEKLDSVILVLLFCFTIFIPLIIGIFQTDKAISEVEKRNLSPLPAIPKTANEFQLLPHAFDDYFSDHFGLREWFTKYYNLAKYTIGDSPSEDVTIGKNGWLFLGSIKKEYKKYGDPIGDVRNANLYSQQELKKFANRMAGLNAWLHEKGIEYIFVIAPNKHTIYGEYLPDYITKINDSSAADQLIEYLKKHTNVSVIDLRSLLIRAKEKAQLYYKTDTHWNHYAANIAQYEIMKRIEKLFPGQIQPEMQKLQDRRGTGGDLANFIGARHLFEEYYPQPIFEQGCTPIRDPLDVRGGTTYTQVCENQKLNAIIFRDSFFNALQPYFSRKFKHSTYISGRLNSSSLTEYIKLENPDIVIEEWVERSLPYVPREQDYYTNFLNKKMFNASSAFIFSIDKAKLKCNAGQNRVNNKNDSLQFVVTGKVPIINCPLLPLEPNNQYILHLNIISSVPSTLKVYYSDAHRTGYPYTAENSIRAQIHKGNNDFYIALDYPNLGKHLRLDFLSKEGEFTITSLEIKKVDGV